MIFLDASKYCVSTEPMPEPMPKLSHSTDNWQSVQCGAVVLQSLVRKIFVTSDAGSALLMCAAQGQLLMFRKKSSLWRLSEELPSQNIWQHNFTFLWFFFFGLSSISRSTADTGTLYWSGKCRGAKVQEWVGEGEIQEAVCKSWNWIFVAHNKMMIGTSAHSSLSFWRFCYYQP